MDDYIGYIICNKLLPRPSNRINRNSNSTYMSLPLHGNFGEGESTSRPSKSPVAKGYYTTVVVGEPVQSAPPEERTGRSGGAMTNGGGDDDGWERRARKLREDEA